MTYRIEGLAPRRVRRPVRHDRRRAGRAGRAAGDRGFADRLSLPRLARGRRAGRGAGAAQPCLARRRRPVPHRLRHLCPQGRARAAPPSPTRRPPISTGARSACAASTPRACCEDGLLAMPGEADAQDPRAVRPARDRHHPRAQRGLWLLPGANREELNHGDPCNRLPRAIDHRRERRPLHHRRRGLGRLRCARDRTMDGRFVTGVHDHRHLLPAVLRRRGSRSARMSEFFATGAEARAAGLRACLRCRPDEVTREAAALGARPSPARRRPRRRPRSTTLAARGRLFAAPFPPPVQARHRRHARGLLPPPARRSAPRRRWPTMAGSPTRSTMPAIPGRPASMPTPGAGSA